MIDVGSMLTTNFQLWGVTCQHFSEISQPYPPTHDYTKMVDEGSYENADDISTIQRLYKDYTKNATRIVVTLLIGNL